jgi:hypothetical protein
MLTWIPSFSSSAKGNEWVGLRNRESRRNRDSENDECAVAREDAPCEFASLEGEWSKVSDIATLRDACLFLSSESNSWNFSFAFQASSSRQGNVIIF